MELPLPKPNEPRFSVERADAVEWLRQRAPRSVDLIVTDPAYESLEKHRSVGTTTRLTEDWFEIFPNSRFPEFFQECHRVLKSDAHMYMMCDSETMFTVAPLAKAVGFTMWTPIIWDKLRMGMGYHYRSRYEFVLFFEKGHRKLNDLSIPNVLEFPSIGPNERNYPTEKPVQLCSTLIKQSSNRGDLVIDPFMGSCPVGVAALEWGRRFAGCDISGRACAFSKERLEGVTSVWATDKGLNP